MVVTFDSGLLFDSESAVIRPDAAQNLRQLAASLEEYPDTDLLIVGHTDSRGGPMRTTRSCRVGAPRRPRATSSRRE